MKLTVKHNFVEVQKALGRLQKQLPFAMAAALTRTAHDVRDAERKEMARAFDRPTRYTLNSLYVKPATKAQLVARVWVKDSDRAAHYLLPQIWGGSRPMKRFEELLRQRGIMGANERAVPGEGAKLDAYGNMSRGQIVQILSQLRTFNLAGFDANATNSKRSRAKRAKVKYFFARQGESRVGGGAWKRGDKVQHLRSGVYAKTARGGLTPVLIFVKGTGYRARLRFFEVGRKTVADRFRSHFANAFRHATKTARF